VLAGHADNLLQLSETSLGREDRSWNSPAESIYTVRFAIELIR
jgi:hypothetical protein